MAERKPVHITPEELAEQRHYAAMVSAMFRRIQLSGEVMEVGEEKLRLVREAVSCYKATRHEIPKLVPFYPVGINQFEDAWICTGFRSEDKTYLCVIRLGEEDTLTIPNVDGKAAKVLYPQAPKAELAATSDGLAVKLAENAGVVIEL